MLGGKVIPFLADLPNNYYFQIKKKNLNKIFNFKTCVMDNILLPLS